MEVRLKKEILGIQFAVHWEDAPAVVAGLMEQSLAVDAVVKDEMLLGIAGAKVGPQQG